MGGAEGCGPLSLAPLHPAHSLPPLVISPAVVGGWGASPGRSASLLFLKCSVLPLVTATGPLHKSVPSAAAPNLTHCSSFRAQLTPLPPATSRL